MPVRAKIYIYGIIGAGALVACGSVMQWHAESPLSFLIYLSLVLALSVIKLRLPGLTGTYSASFLALLFGLNHFSFGGMMAAAAVAGMAQSLLNVKHRPLPVQVAFNVSNMILSVALCFAFMQSAKGLVGGFQPALFCGAAVLFFAVNTVIVSGVLSLLEGKSLGSVWESWYLWSFAYYLVGSALLGLVTSSMRSAEGWLVLLPVVFLIHFYYGLTVCPAGAAEPDSGSRAPVTALPRAAHMLIVSVIITGFTLFVWSAMNWKSENAGRFVCVLALAAIAAACKITLPKMTGTMSLLFVILLFGVALLSLSEMLAIAAFSAPVQCLWRAKKRPAPIQVLFNMAILILSTAAAMGAFRVLRALLNIEALSALLVAATLVLYAVNSILVAAVLCFIESKPLSSLWQNCCFWSLPYYMIGSATSGLMIVASRDSNWGAPLMVLAMMALIYASYRAQVRQATGTSAVA